MKNLSIFFVLVLAGCYDEASSHYQTIQEAGDRTWLPAPGVIPESAFDIDESHNVDFNTAVGEFHYAPADSKEFFAKLSKGAPEKSPYTGWAATVTDYKDDGFTPLTYLADGSEYVFFCNGMIGHCHFFSWPIRDRA